MSSVRASGHSDPSPVAPSPATCEDSAHDPNGGGFKAVNTSLYLSDCNVHDNTAHGDGGGVWVGGWKAELTVGSQGSINNNTAGGNGGGIAGRNAHVKMETSTSVTGNQAAIGGGGVYVISDADYEQFRVGVPDMLFQTVGNEYFPPVMISGNRAMNGDGGGVLVVCTVNVNGIVPIVDLSYVTIQDNKAFGTPPAPGGEWASGRGGGIATRGTIKVDADEGTLIKLNGQSAPAPTNPPAKLGVFFDVLAPGSTFVGNAVVTNDNYQIISVGNPPPPGGP